MDLSKKLNNYPHLTGTIEVGSARGRQMGVPTINLPLPKNAGIKLGVYASFIEVDGQFYQSVTNVGAAKTFNSTENKAETHVLDPLPNIQDLKVTVYLIKYLREVQKFPSIDHLVAQINQDIARSKEVLRAF